jgi:flagellar basal body-associated protein FliL
MNTYFLRLIIVIIPCIMLASTAGAASFPVSANATDAENSFAFPMVEENIHVSVFKSANRNNSEFRIKEAQKMIKTYWANTRNSVNKNEDKNNWLIIPLIALMTSFTVFFFQMKKANTKDQH